MEFISRSYLMLLNIATPAPEHVRIKEILQAISAEYRAVYFDSHGGAFLFNTGLAPHVVASRINPALLTDDRYLIVEVGPHWYTHDNNIARAWFAHHLGKEDG